MIREITIKPALNGYIITVGCATLVCEGREHFLVELERYLRSPKTVEEEYLRNAVNPDSPIPFTYDPLLAEGIPLSDLYFGPGNINPTSSGERERG